MTTTTAPVCPECGTEVQATVRVYLTLTDDGWDFAMQPDADGVALYCVNDHDLTDNRELDETRSDAAMLVASAIERGAT